MKSYKWKDFFGLIHKAKPNIILFIFSCLISSISAIVATFIPSLLKRFIDSYAANERFDNKLLLSLIAIFILNAIVSVLAGYLLSVVGLKVIANLRKITWSKIVKLPVAYFDKHESGDIASRVVNDTNVLYTLVSNSFSQFINAILTILFCGFWMFYYDWKLSLIVVIALPLFLILFIPLGRKMSKLSKEVQKSTGELNVNAFEMISENKLVKSFTAEGEQISKGVRVIDHLKNIGVQRAKWIATVNPILNLIMMMIIFSIVGFGGVQLANGNLSAGTFMAFLTLIFYIIGPITNFGVFFTQLQQAKGATERISKIHAESEENIHEGNIFDITDKDIEFKDISFSYNTERESSFSLQNINLVIKGGHTYALVGPSGSGKTTLISLLERFYKPTSGSIYIGKENIESYSLNSWRSQIGYVSQEHTLINGTIRENLLFGLEDECPNEEKIIQACQMAYAWEFIEKLPFKLDSHIGERGLELSGGQRQRIAIARMFLKDPKIILLDEATSSLDSQSEEKVKLAMRKISEGRTAISIAHRLSTIVDAENIIFLENGEITGIGKHVELQQTHRLYNQFCEQQLQA
ncbi:ABC transporter ATP-binding protein [Rummeliibacillus stabekisii]|uniref:ATP-binding protein n=1 Tax=Rummeliibacillus stabekisii TaxID=241244 RepID=A0A143HHD8_9BACL|nr:ABC transporter ATP-binding protein [Rummeliibacillus stabekisii]AMX01103.1 ATP-binding protein [Rummeliibacillus stabekisii]